MNDTVNALLTRRSVLARDLKAPGPTPEQIDDLLAAAHRVPDHGKIGPWRFVLFEGDARGQFGEQLARIFLQDNPDTTPKCIDFEQQRLLRAPLVIAVISSPVDHKVPEWEQVLSCGAACQNMLTAATAMGFGAQWLTEWYAYHKDVDSLLGLNAREKVAGYIYIGSYDDKPNERNRPALDERISRWEFSNS